MKLNTPNTIERVFRRELPPEFDYLSGDGPTWIEITCVPGGYVNQGLVQAIERIEHDARVASLEMADTKDKSDLVRKMDEARAKRGRDRFTALYRHCVKSWGSNILDGGAPIKPSADTFLALSEVRIPAISAVLVEFAEYVERVGDFVAKADEEAEKN